MRLRRNWGAGGLWKGFPAGRSRSAEAPPPSPSPSRGGSPWMAAGYVRPRPARPCPASTFTTCCYLASPLTRLPAPPSVSSPRLGLVSSPPHPWAETVEQDRVSPAGRVTTVISAVGTPNVPGGTDEKAAEGGAGLWGWPGYSRLSGPTQQTQGGGHTCPRAASTRFVLGGTACASLQGCTVTSASRQ